MISRDDRISTLLKQDESLVDVFVSLSPAFERLRNKTMRKVMARLVTVEQAANMAGIDADVLVSSLNAHVAGGGVRADGSAGPGADVRAGEGAPSGEFSNGELANDGPSASQLSSDESTGGESASSERSNGEPAELARIPEELRRVVDVREELRAGNEPFSQIMAARREVPDGGAFAVRAIFEPVPLYAVMRKQGLAHYTEHLGDEDWRVWFYPSSAVEDGSRRENSGAPTGAPGRVAARSADTEGSKAGLPLQDPAGESLTSPDDESDAGVVVLDVRWLEPPEPMMQTLAALETLPRGNTLVQLNVRVPQFLLPILEERGFEYEIREQEPDLVRVFIKHRTA